MPNIPENLDAYTTTRIRGMCREGFEMATSKIVGIAMGESEGTSPAVQIRAYESLGKYGLGKPASLLMEANDLLRLVSTITLRHLGSKESFEKWKKEVLQALDRA